MVKKFKKINFHSAVNLMLKKTEEELKAVNKFFLANNNFETLTNYICNASSSSS